MKFDLKLLWISKTRQHPPTPPPLFFLTATKLLFLKAIHDRGVEYHFNNTVYFKCHGNDSSMHCLNVFFYFTSHNIRQRSETQEYLK